MTFAGLRFAFCGIVICVYAFIKDKHSYEPLKKHYRSVLLSGFFAIILHYAFTYIGLTMTDGSKTAILKQLGAIFYVCFSSLFFPDDKITFKKVVGLLLGMCGIVAINLNSSGITFHIGDLLIVGASFCTVFSNVISKKVFRYIEPIVSTGISQLFGGFVLLTVGVLLGGNLTTGIPKTAPQGIVFGVILTASVFSYCLWYLNVQKENLSTLFIIKFAEPIFAAVFGWLLLGEDIFNLNYIAAFVLICAGIVFVNVKQRNPKFAQDT